MVIKIENILPAVILLPLFSSIIIFLFGYKIKRLSGYIGCGSVFLSFLSSLYLFVKNKTFLQNGGSFVVELIKWIPVENTDVSFSLLFDSLSAVALLYVTGVSFLVHIYSLDYMKGDERFSRYFAFLNLFVFFMTSLVLSSNLLQIFLGWEGVGLCSYLLIGFWYKDLTNSRAGFKAFIVNRVGDFGFVIGIILTFLVYGGFDFRFLEQVQKTEHFKLIGLFLFCGALGKSAQGPLFIWLPDAMRGPTPVSALIHAATMVTAGVFMVVRLNFIYSHLSWFVFAVGVSTSILCGVFAIFERDIKKILAYSTISQLGFMFCGASAIPYLGLYHVFEHSFFKALLFLVAGCLMHRFHVTDVLELREKRVVVKGGLLLSLIGWTIGTLSMAGIFPFSGFWSKGAILEGAKHSFGKFGFSLLILSSTVTTLYLARVFFLVFWNEIKFAPSITSVIKNEGGIYMFLSVSSLSLLSIIGGIFNVGSWLGEKFFYEEIHFSLPEEIVIHLWLFLVFSSGFWLWSKGERLERKGLASLLWKKLYIDEIEVWLSITSTRILSIISGIFDKSVIDLFVNKVASNTRGFSYTQGFLDKNVVDGFVNFIANFTRAGGFVVRVLQMGVVQVYLLISSVSVFVLLWFHLRR